MEHQIVFKRKKENVEREGRRVSIITNSSPLSAQLSFHNPLKMDKLKLTLQLVEFGISDGSCCQPQPNKIIKWLKSWGKSTESIEPRQADLHNGIFTWFRLARSGSSQDDDEVALFFSKTKKNL